MKKIILSIFAVAALFSCSKSDIIYTEQVSEIGFSPVAKSITKSALGVEDHVYPTAQNIGVWSNYDGSVPHGTTVNYTTSFTTAFINDKQFTYHSDVNPVSWAGVTPYFWPTNGSLVFAGYSMTAPATAGTEAPAVGTSRSYDFATDEMIINGYTQSLNPATSFDLLWFGRTATSYNLRNQAAAVSVVFQHALSWITIKVAGLGLCTDVNNPWKVTSVVLNNIKDKGNVKMIGEGTNQAAWTNVTDSDSDFSNNKMTIFTGAQTLLNNAASIETTKNGTLVIPQSLTKANDTDVIPTLTIKYKYNTPAGVEIEETSTVSLSLDGAKDKNGNAIASTHTSWQSGFHYIYTLTFNAKEILIAPTVIGWEDVNQSINVN